MPKHEMTEREQRLRQVFTMVREERKVAGTGLCLDANLHKVTSLCTWTQATGEWINTVNDEGFAGFSDWRVPNVKELQSIVDYGERLPAIDPTFPGETALQPYWSATPDSASSGEAWFVNFGSGTVFTFFQSIAIQVRAVRSGPCPTP